MKIVRIDTSPPALTEDAQPLSVANYLVARLFQMRSGALCGAWDEAAGEGTWFHCRDATAMFGAVSVEEVIRRESVRGVFRSLVFRIGSMAAEAEGELCGVVRLLPLDPAVDPGPERHCHVHASFEPAAGLWLRAAVINVGGF
jgi:hypothetical protein